LVYIPQGSSSLEIGKILSKKGIINWDYGFWLWCKILGVERKLKFGYYKLSPQEDLFEIINKLIKGTVETLKFTIPEGSTLENIADILESKLHLSKENFLKLAENPKNLGKIKDYFKDEIPTTLEGYLFPATYDVPLDLKEEDIIYILLRTFFNKLDIEIPNWREELKKRNMTLKEWVTLASIVEKEAKYDDERPLIAGTFLNRIKLGYKLQSCATVEYIYKFKKPVLSYNDLKIDSPYNTYIYYGLPPSPICSPSINSLKAVLYPQGDYLFFVSKGDGRHYFSKTYEEHLRFQRSNEK